MKKSINLAILSLAFLFLASVVSCSSTKKVDQSNSSDYVEAEATEIKVPTIKVENNTNALSNIIAGDKKDIELATTALSQETVLDQLKQENAVVIYNLKTSKAGFYAWFQASNYHMLFDNITRVCFDSSVKQYISDFENKNLSRKNRKSYKVYGEYPITVQWGTIPTMLSGEAAAKVQFGYKFKDNAPYFTITMFNVKNEKSDSSVKESGTVYFYFTKEQAQNLTNLLSDESISKALEPYMSITNQSPTPEADSYVEK